MVTRRNALKDSTDKLPKLIEEAGMRHFIAVSYRRIFLRDVCSHASLESEIH